MSKVISEKEYAEICLNCPYRVCHGTSNGCERTYGYRVIREKEKEEQDDEE